MNHRCLPLLALLATPLSSQLNTTSVWDDAPIVHLVDLDDGKSNAIVGSVSPDELTMFFASDRTGGTGGWDLWHSTRSSLRGKWQAPIQVPGANTTADECSPTVYFAPDGSLEMFFIRKQAASWDVWTAKRTTSGTWSAPTKMGAEVNATGIFNAYLDVTYDGTLVSVTRKVAQAYYAYDLKRVMVSSAFQAAILIPAVQLRSSDTIELSHDGKLGLFHALDSKQTRRWVLARKQPVRLEAHRATLTPQERDRCGDRSTDRAPLRVPREVRPREYLHAHRHRVPRSHEPGRTSTG